MAERRLALWNPVKSGAISKPGLIGRRRWAVPAALIAAVTGTVALAPESAAPAAPGAAALSRALPARIYAPFFEAYRSDNLGMIAHRAGVRFVTLAFVASAGRSGASACRLAWGGIGDPLSRGRYRPAARALRARGGGAILGFGGWNADQGGIEIAESCHDVRAIAASYERAISSYHAIGLSVDLEGPVALTDKASISRRDEAFALAEHWAKARRIPLRVQLTLPIEPTGLNRKTMAVIRDAVRNHATISSIGLMVFDYYFIHETRPLKMAALAIRAAVNVHRQLRAVYPRLTSAQIWARLGFTMMPGIDGYPRGTEVTYLPDARKLMSYARARQMSYLSIWALQRDNGNCPGLPNAGTCSGIAQQPWAFSHLLGRFTG